MGSQSGPVFSDAQTAVSYLRDEDLVSRWQGGERAVFRTLFERYRRRVYTLAYGIVGDREGAEDLTQDVFLKVFEKLGGFRSEARFFTWLYRLTVNACLAHNRKRKRRLDRIRAVAPEADGLFSRETPDPGALLLRREVATRISLALQALSPKMRVVVVLKDQQGLSYEEIAAILKCSKGTVGSRLNRARTVLQKRLKDIRP